MKCWILFSRRNKKNIISLLSAEFTSSMVGVKNSNKLLNSKYFLSELKRLRCADAQPDLSLCSSYTTFYDFSGVSGFRRLHCLYCLFPAWNRAASIPS